MRIYIDKGAIRANEKALEGSRPPFTPPKPLEPVIVVQNRRTGEEYRGSSLELSFRAIPTERCALPFEPVDTGKITYDPSKERGGNASVWLDVPAWITVKLDGRDLPS